MHARAVERRLRHVDRRGEHAEARRLDERRRLAAQFVVDEQAKVARLDEGVDRAVGAALAQRAVERRRRRRRRRARERPPVRLGARRRLRLC